MRSPVPQSRMNCVPSGAISSRQGVFPPYRHVAGSTVGVDPRTPQKLNLAMGTVIALSAKPLHEGSFHTNTDRKSTRLNSSHQIISYAVFCLKKKNKLARR